MSVVGVECRREGKQENADGVNIPGNFSYKKTFTFMTRDFENTLLENHSTQSNSVRIAFCFHSAALIPVLGTPSQKGMTQ